MTLIPANAPFRLFKVIVEGKPVFFKERMHARAARIEHGGVVMRGPDHRRGESFNVSEQTPSSKGAEW